MLTWATCDCWRVAIQEKGKKTKPTIEVGNKADVVARCKMLNRSIKGWSIKYIPVMSKYNEKSDYVLSAN